MQTRDSKNQTAATRPRYIMIGGFLGAGKTTAVGRLAERLCRQGRRVGLITNDQGRNLVDTTFLRWQGFPTEEIAGGCFCCRFNSLVEAAQRLWDQSQPDVFIAEPVGSCTDLVATVTYPLRQLHEGHFTVAPVSVLVDPIRARRVFGLETGGSFSDKVLYIYLKQLEEADLIVISKCDLLAEVQLQSLRDALRAKFPHKQVLAVSARLGTNLEAWFDQIAQAEQPAGHAMEVDYSIYADGEALLGWLNCTLELSAEKAFDADKYLKDLAGGIRLRLSTAGAEVAHLKMALATANDARKLAVVNVVRNDFLPESMVGLGEPVGGGLLTLNLRAEATPALLEKVVRQALTGAAATFAGLEARVSHFEYFRPGKPTPTHRFQSSLS
jgi:G3E family GTPase